MCRFCLVVLFFTYANFLAHAEASGQEGRIFQEWQINFEKKALLNGITAEVLEKAFKSLKPDLSVLEAAQNQAEFKRAIWDYLDRAVSVKRLKKGKKKYALLKEDLLKIYQTYSVEPEILVAIWGLESSYGEILNNEKIVKNVVRSLSTLAAFDERRANFATAQLIAALKILQNGDIDANHMTGSWAGAMGHTQFIPTTYLQFAVDFDGDSKRNIWHFELDALASAAHYLHQSGWQKDLPWGVEVALPKGFDYFLADKNLKKSLKDWQRLGVKILNEGSIKANTLTKQSAYLYLPSGYQGPAFLLFKNFDVLKRYNNANAYALAIGLISNGLKDKPLVVAEWPRHLKPLDKNEVEVAQRLLTESGFDAGGIDGLVGPKTRRAVRSFQKSKQLVPDGFLTEELLKRLQIE